MSDASRRDHIVTLLIVIAAVLLAVALFVAGAIWRGHAVAKPKSVAVEWREP